MSSRIHQYQSERVEIWVDVLFRTSLDSADREALQHFADEAANFPHTQVWIFAPDSIQIGKVPENLLLKEVTNEVTEKNRWLLIKRPNISRHLYDCHYVIAVVCPAESASTISDAIQGFWHSYSRKHGERVLIKVRTSK